jgi:negative regulator of sigma E activity
VQEACALYVFGFAWQEVHEWVLHVRQVHVAAAVVLELHCLLHQCHCIVIMMYMSVRA